MERAPFKSSPQLMQPTNYGAIALIVLMWIAWVAVTIVADFMAFIMFAFADSPGSAKAAKVMIVPIFIWFGVAFLAGVVLLVFRGWWQVPLAFVLAISPPFLVFAGYNLLAATQNVSARTSTPAVPPTAPPGVYVPPATTLPTIPEQPDFQKLIDEARRAANQPMKD